MHHLTFTTRESKTTCTRLTQCSLWAIGILITHEAASIKINLLTTGRAENHLLLSPIALGALFDVFIFVYWHVGACTGSTEPISKFDGLNCFTYLLDGNDWWSHIAYCYTQRLQEDLQENKIVHNKVESQSTTNCQRVLIGHVLCGL